MVAEYGNNIDNNDNNNTNEVNNEIVEENAAIYRILVKFQEFLKWQVYVAAHLLDPRFDNSLFTAEEREAGLEHIKKHAIALFEDENIWDNGLHREVMNYRCNIGVWSRREFQSLDESCTIDDVIRVLIYIRKDYPNSMVANMCKLAIDILIEEGTNAEIERTFNFWQLDETPQSNRLKSETRDKKAFVWNFMHFRERTHDFNEYLQEMQR